MAKQYINNLNHGNKRTPDKQPLSDLTVEEYQARATRLQSKKNGKITMSDHNKNSPYLGSAMVHLTRYPHGSPTVEDCGCAVCEEIFIKNESIKPCKNPKCDHLTNTGNFGYCHDCTKSALDNAFNKLQDNLGIPKNGL